MSIAPIYHSESTLVASPRYDKNVITSIILQIPADVFAEIGLLLSQGTTPRVRELGNKLVAVSGTNANG